MVNKRIQWSGWRDEYLRQHAFGKTDKELASYLGVSATSVMNRRREMFGRMRESKQQRYARLDGIGIADIILSVKSRGLGAVAKGLKVGKHTLEQYLTDSGVNVDDYKNKVSESQRKEHTAYIQNNKGCMSIIEIGRALGKSEMYVRNIMIDEEWILVPGSYTAYKGDDYVCTGDIHTVAKTLGMRPSQVVYKAYPLPRSRADASGGLYIFKDAVEEW